MSRSYKKNPIYTDGRKSTPKENKQIANRTVRRYNKRIVKGYLDYDYNYRDKFTLDGKTYKRYFNSWEIHDWVSRWSKAQALCDYEHPHWHYNSYKDEWWHIWEEYKNEKQFLNYWAKYHRRK